jgi:hypothetical protein
MYPWAVQASGTDYVRGFGLIYDGAGGALVTGDFKGKASFGSLSLTSPGDADAFVLHVNASGSLDWAMQVDGTSDVRSSGIATDGAGGALVTGSFDGNALFGATTLTSSSGFDAFVMHVTASGTIAWAVQAGGESYSLANGIAYDGAGGALVTGDFRGVASFGSTLLTSRGFFDAFVMHVKASGAIDWAVQVGDASSDSNHPTLSEVRGSGIAHDGTGGALVTGFFTSKALFGATSLTSSGSFDAFVMHVTASGTVDWAVQAGGRYFDVPNGIAYDGAGGALVTGYFTGSSFFGSTLLASRGGSDIFVMHVTASGAIDWAVQAGGTLDDEGLGIAYDGVGGALVTGYFSETAFFDSTSLTSQGLSDAFVMHVTAAGFIDWVVQAGGTFYTTGWGIAYDGGSGSALVTGYFMGRASFGSTSLTSFGNAATCFAALLIPPPPWPRALPHTPPWSLSLPVVVAALASSLALLLGLLLACGFRRQCRHSEHLRVSRDRAQLDLQLLEHRFKQRTKIVFLVEDAPGHVPARPPSEALPCSVGAIAQGPRCKGSKSRGCCGSGAGSVAAGSSIASVSHAVLEPQQLDTSTGR